MSPETIDIQPAPINPNSARPANRRTHYHVGQDLKSAQRRQQCLALRLEGLHLHEIAQRLGVSKSSVHAHLQQAQALSHAAIAKMGAQLLEQERAKLQAIVDRWLPIATGSRRAKEAARAAEIVRKTSDRLRVLYGLETPAVHPADRADVNPEAASLLTQMKQGGELDFGALLNGAVTAQPVNAQPPPPAVSEPAELEPDVELRAFSDPVMALARAGLLPNSSYDAAWDVLDAWQPGKYRPPAAEVQAYLRADKGANWKMLVSIPFTDL